MAWCECSNQRPDALLQDRTPACRNLLRRTAGPNIGSWTEELNVSTTSPLSLSEFNRSVQHCFEFIRWGFEAQCLSRALIEPQGDRVEAGLGDAREIGSSREVLS
jgi:hypothetical protein